MWVDLCYAEQGRGHIEKEVPCQDKTYSLNRNGVYAVSLSDGLGSAKLSHLGAELTTKTACEYLADNFDSVYKNEDANSVRELLVDGILSKLQALADEQECTTRDLDCTLLAVAIKDDKFLIFHTGDGAIGVMMADEMKVASKPMNAEFANATFPISGGKKSLKLMKGELKNIRAFVMMSDGSTQCLYKKNEAYFANAVTKIINNLTFMPLDSVKDSVIKAFKNTVIQKTKDDCSIALLVKRDSETSKYNELSFEDKCELLLVNSKARNAKYVLSKMEIMLKMMQHPVTIEELSQNSGIKSIRYLKIKLKKLIRNNIVYIVEKRYCSAVQI